MCASHRIAAQRSCFFWPWQQSGKHVADCNEYREAFLNTALAKSLRQRA